MENAKNTEILMNTLELLAIFNKQASDKGEFHIISIDLMGKQPVVDISKELPCMKPRFISKNFITMEAIINGISFRKDYVRSLITNNDEFNEVYKRINAAKAIGDVTQ